MSRHPWRGHHPGWLRSNRVDTEQKNREEHARAMEREAIMRRYEEARRQLQAPVSLTYESGWVIVRPAYTTRYMRVRLAELARLAAEAEATLHERELNQTEDT